MTVPYNFNFELLLTNLLLKNFRFTQYAFIPRAIVSLTSSSIDFMSFMMDPKYFYSLTCSIYELLIFKFYILMSFFWRTLDILFSPRLLLVRLPMSYFLVVGVA